MKRKKPTDRSGSADPGAKLPPLTGVVDFFQTKGFSRNWDELGLTDEGLKELENLLLYQPQSGAVVPGTGGLRKLRFAPPGWKTGKSGGLRVGYAHFPEGEVILLLVCYAKTTQADLSPEGKKIIKRVIELQREELSKRRKS